MGGEGGSVYSFLLLALVVRPLATHHPFRDGAPSPLLIETPPTFGRSLRFSHVLHRKGLLILSPSCFAVCGHHLSPRIAIVFSLLSSLPNSSMRQPSNSLAFSSNASRSSLYISHSTFYYCCATRAHMCIHVLLPTYWYISFSFW